MPRLPRPACPCISTLRLDLAKSRNQWFLLPKADNSKTIRRLSRPVIGDSTSLGTFDLRIPLNTLPNSNGENWVTPYWNTVLNELRFRLRSGDDLDHYIPLSRIGNLHARPLAKLAVHEGLIKGFEETRASCADRGESYKRAYNDAVWSGFQGSFEEWQRAPSLSKNGLILIRTLIFEKAKQTGQILLPTRKLTAHARAIYVGGVVVGRVYLRPPSQSYLDLSTGYCLAFDAKTCSLQYRTLDGEIIPEPTYSLMQLAAHHRPLLELAKAEGLIDDIPDTQLSSFDLDVSIQRKFVAVSQSQILNASPPRSVPSEYHLIPYIDADQTLRVWNVDTKEDMEVKKGVYHRSASEVRRMSPELFEYAQSLGHWKGL